VHSGEYHRLGIALPAYDTLDRSVDQRTSRGTFAHELGHILGFRHEHIRPEALQPPFSYDCFDEPVSEGYDPWRTIPGATQYDPESVLHYGTGRCGPLRDFALTDTDRAAAHLVYESPTRCEVWAGSTQLALTEIAAPTSAIDGESSCATFASAQQRDGLSHATVERHPDHFRAIMLESTPMLESDGVPASEGVSEAEVVIEADPARAAFPSERTRDRRRWAERAARRRPARP
jgi:hypothetical protein